MTCGKGIQVRTVSCVSKKTGQLLGEESCEASSKPNVEKTCAENPECHHEVPQSSNVEHKNKHQPASDMGPKWIKGEWTEVSYL